MPQPIAEGFVVCAASALLAAAVSAQPIVYVDVDAPAGGEGGSWAEAYRSLHQALSAATLEPAIEEIWVAEGVYTPDRGLGDRDDAFELVSGVSLYGGFAGNETSVDERVPGAHPTVLSGDFAGDDVIQFPTRVGAGEIPPLPGFQNYEENAHHVVTGFDLIEPVTFDGFIVRGGNADFDGALMTGGGGMLIERSLFTLSNCRFEFNRCGWDEPDTGGLGGAVFLRVGEYLVTECEFLTNRGMNGGALAIYAPSETETVTCTVTDCAFTGNFAEQQVAGALWSAAARELIVTDCSFTGNFAQYGGAIVDQEPRQPASKTFLRCTFVDNRSLVQAGAIWHFRLSTIPDTEKALFQDCHFENNSTSGGVGGGLLLWSIDATVIRSRFVGNSAVWGGGVCQVQSPVHSRAGALDVFGSLFHGNEATNGGAVATSRCDALRIGGNTFTENSATGSGGAVNVAQGGVAAQVSNNVLWNNDVNGDQSEAGQIAGEPRDMTFCLVQGLVDPGEGNIDGDPLFVNPGVGDFRLGPGSPAIDAGDNSEVPADVGDLDDDEDRTESLPEDFAGEPRFQDDPSTADTGLGTPPIVDIGAFEFLSGVTAVFDADPSMPNPLIRTQSNPARGAAELVLELDRDRFVTVDVFDARGGRVRRLTRGVMGHGDARLHWDGRDDRGRLVVTGVYLVRVTTPEESGSLKLLFIR